MYAKVQPESVTHVYYFSIDSKLEGIASGGQGPGGERLYVRYVEPASVKTDRDLYQGSWRPHDYEYEHYWRPNDPMPYIKPEPPKDGTRPTWHGLWGKIASGGDFSLLRNDRVLQLDGRVTVLSSDDTLLDLVYHGLVDIREDPEALSIPVFLSVTVETASGPFPTALGEDLGWINKRYLAHQENFWRYEELTRQLFIAVGTLRLGPPTPHRLPEQLQLDVFSVRVTGGA